MCKAQSRPALMLLYNAKVGCPKQPNMNQKGAHNETNGTKWVPQSDDSLAKTWLNELRIF